MSVWAAASLLAAWTAAAQPPYGVLILAHGGETEWNREVTALRDALAAELPAEVAFGMAMPDAIEAAVRKLEAARPAKIVAVPLFVNSASEVLEQTRFVLGLSERPSRVLMAAAHHHPGHISAAPRRVAVGTPLVMTPAIDDHPLAAEVLTQRAKALSKQPFRETVVLVAHGPVDDKALKSWESALRSLAQAVRRDGGFRSVKGELLRDDAPPAVRSRAVSRFREAVSRAGAEGRAVVVPVLIAKGGIEGKVVAALKGLNYAWDGRPLLPHANIERWLRDSAAWGARRDDMRRFGAPRARAGVLPLKGAAAPGEACGEQAPACSAVEGGK